MTTTIVSESCKPLFGMDSVNVSLLDGGAAGATRTPLLITPRWDDSLNFLKQWLKINRSWVGDMLLRHGSVMIRGFNIDSAVEMESAVKSFEPTLNNTYRGTSPRHTLEGTDYVFSAAEVPTNYPIAQHIEMSFLPEPPKQLFFCCLQPSKSAGGETAVADFRKVYQDIPADLKQKFLDKGIRYTRTHKKRGTYFTYDVSDMLGWPELFGTSDKMEVEEMCKKENIPFEWCDGDTFVSTTQSDAFQLHPTTKEHVWFNHTQVFHWTTFPAELWFAFRRTCEWRLLFHFTFVFLFCMIKYGILGHKMSLHATFGDGEPISIKEMGQIRKAIHDSMIYSRWQKGDLLFIDNFSTSHGRQPTYDKGRKVAVAWSDPVPKANDVVSLEHFSVIEQPCMENPQERTPESTLTRQDSAALHEDFLSKELDAKLKVSVLAASQNPQEEDRSDTHTREALHNLFQA